MNTVSSIAKDAKTLSTVSLELQKSLLRNKIFLIPIRVRMQRTKLPLIYFLFVKINIF